MRAKVKGSGCQGEDDGGMKDTKFGLPSHCCGPAFRQVGDKDLCRCFGAPARRVFPDHLITLPNCQSAFVEYHPGVQKFGSDLASSAIATSAFARGDLHVGVEISTCSRSLRATQLHGLEQ